MITETRELPQFQSICFNMVGKVVYKSSSTKNSGIQITAENDTCKKILTKVKNNCLYVYGNDIQTQSEIEFIIYSSMPLQEIVLDGVLSKGSQFDVGITKTLNITNNAVVNNLTIKGFVRQCTIHSEGTGDIDATLLDADIATLTQEGVGKLKMTVNSEVSTRLSGIGDILVYGSAKCINNKKLGIGTITFKEKL